MPKKTAVSADKPNYTELAHQVVQAAPEPLPFAEIMRRVTALTPTARRDLKSALRSAVSQSRLIAATGDGRYGWMPRLITGSVLRLTLSAADLEHGRVSFTEEAREALWPTFFEIQKRSDRAPVRVQLPDGTLTAWPLVHFGETRWGTTATPEFARWLQARRPQPRDDLLVTAVDGEARLYAVNFQRRADRDEAAIAGRNRAILEAATAFVRSHPSMPMLWDLAAHLLASGRYRHPVPPEALRHLWTASMNAVEAAYKYRGFSGGRVRAEPPAAPEDELDTLLQDFFRKAGRVRAEPPAEPARRSAAPERIYQLKVTLKGLRPPVWRRLQVPADLTLARLHRLLQTAMGWYDSHLHHFRAGGVYYSTPSPEDWEPVRDERRYRLEQVAPAARSRILYEYDFGDSWEHDLVVEKILAPEPGVRYPRCLAGARACPPEDVGGVWGYAEFLAALADPDHPEHDSYLEWVGGEFDPERFDLEAVNTTLRRLQ